MNQKPELQLSEKVSQIPEALSVYMNNVVYKMKRRGDRIRVLSLGEAFFDIPMFPFGDIDFTKGYHYSESRGLTELREIICRYYLSRYGAAVNPESEILVSAGSKPLIYMAFQAVLNPGDEVLIPEPAWLSYPEEIKLANGVPRYIPYDCPVAGFSRYFTEKTRMMVLNNPNNPSGRVYTSEELGTLCEACRSRGIYILMDEAYSDFVIDGSFHSLAKLVPDKNGIIVVNSLSKNLGISGWRVGYAVSSEKVIYNMLKLNQHLITCPSTVLLLYLSKYFEDIVKITKPQIEASVKKRQEISSYIEKIGMEALPGSATFYLFLSIGDYPHSSLDLALYLLMKYHISVVPGSAYGKSTERFIRIGIGAESMGDIRDALQIIQWVEQSGEFDSELIERELAALDMNRFQPLGTAD